MHKDHPVSDAAFVKFLLEHHARLSIATFWEDVEMFDALKKEFELAKNRTVETPTPPPPQPPSNLPRLSEGRTAFKRIIEKKQKRREFFGGD